MTMKIDKVKVEHSQHPEFIFYENYSTPVLIIGFWTLKHALEKIGYDLVEKKSSKQLTTK